MHVDECMLIDLRLMDLQKTMIIDNDIYASNNNELRPWQYDYDYTHLVKYH